MKVKLAMMVEDTKFRFLTLEDPLILQGALPNFIVVHDNTKPYSFTIADEVFSHFIEKCKKFKEHDRDMTILVIAGEIIGVLNKIEKDSELVSTLYEFNRTKDLITIKNHSLVKFRKNSDTDVEYFIPYFYIDNNQKGYIWNDNKNKNIKPLAGHKDEIDW